MIRKADELAKLLDRELSLTVVLGRKEVSIESLLSYSEGSILVLGPAETGALELEIEGRGVARGTAVQMGDRLGLRIDDLPEGFARGIQLS